MKRTLLTILLLPVLALSGQDAMFFAITGLTPSEIGNWSIIDAAYESQLLISAREDVIQGVFVGKDGTRMYICGHTNDRIDQYNLSTAHDVTTAVYESTLSVSSYTNYPQDLCWDKSGTHLYFIDASSARVVQFTCSTAWELSSASYTGVVTIGGFAPSPDGICISDDGMTMLIVSDSSDKIHTMTMSAPFTISTGSNASKELDISGQDVTSCAVCASNDGTVVWMVGRTGDYVSEYTLTTAWDISTGSYSTHFYVGSQDGSPMGMSFARDGSKMYIAGNSTDKVFQYDLNPAN